MSTFPFLTPPSPQTQETLTTDQLALLLGISRRTIYRLTEKGELPFEARRIGGRMLFSREAVQRWLAGDHGNAVLEDKE